MQNMIDLLNSISLKMSENEMVIGTVLGVLFMVAKIISTEKSVPVISLIQKAMDGIAQILIGAGNLVALGAKYLGAAIKSDGILGKK